ncbi:MAG: MFS transporter [Opitutales bacterium]|nr:MFS transporter [Opitutales bacterium]
MSGVKAHPIAVPAIVWVAALYFVQGLPNAVVDLLAPVALKDLNYGNAVITFVAAWAYLPWVLKALWSPLVDAVGRKRHWVVLMQLAMALLYFLLGILFACVVPATVIAILLFLLAVLSATHDIAADGFYLLALEDRDQKFYSGFRNLFFRLSQVFARGGIIVFAGTLMGAGLAAGTAWRYIFCGIGATAFVLSILHYRILPFPPKDLPAVANRSGGNGILKNFVETWKTFFQKKSIVGIVLFLLLFRLGEVQLGAVSPLFMKDSLESGGLALDNVALGGLYGTIGVIALLLGGVLGGIAVAKSSRGLSFWLLPMALALNLPDFIYIALAHWQIQDYNVLAAGIAIEQFGYGFGFTGYMLYMLKISAGTRHAVAHYAICSAFMALSAFLPKIWSGALQEFLGYELYFYWAILCTIPGFAVAVWAAKNLKTEKVVLAEL